jgi:hypothetical protein
MKKSVDFSLNILEQLAKEGKIKQPELGLLRHQFGYGILPKEITAEQLNNKLKHLCLPSLF